MGHKRQRHPALILLEQALKCDISSNILQHHVDPWKKFKDDLKNKYCQRMKALMSAKDLDWTSQWCYSIKLLGTDVQKGIGVVNSLLSVEEKAFKSSDANIRL